MATAPEEIADGQTDGVQGVEQKPDAARDFYAEPEPEKAPDEGELEPAEEQPEPIAAPKSWSKEDQEVWDRADRGVQEVFARRQAEIDGNHRRVTMEAARTRETVEGEARQRLMRMSQNHAAQMEQYASMFNPQQPDLRLLNSDDPNERSLYFQQEAQYRHAAAHREQANRQAQEARQQALGLEQYERQQAIAADEAKLVEVLQNEWSDPSERANLLARLEPIAVELGYSQELISQAGADDILALRKVAELKAKADKYDAANKAKMIPVREARQIPPTARTMAPNGQSRQVSLQEQLYPNDVRRN